MAYTTIDDPSAHFQIATYTGAGNSSSVTFGGNSDLQPDWLWVKRRDSADNSKVFDTSRGIGSGNEPYLSTTLEEEEQTYGYLTSVDSDGFTWDTVDSSTGASSNTYVAWAWKCNGGTTSSFTESGNNPGGTIQTNTTAGFSIITTTGTGGAGTIAHGLGAVPHLIISKGRSNSGGWVFYHRGNTSAPETDALNLATNGATVDAVAFFNDTAPTSSVFTLGTTNDVNGDGRTYVHYVFTEIQGYSKFGNYTGDGNGDGPFLYTGFKPRWVMFKRTDAAEEWYIYDTERDPINVMDRKLFADINNAEQQSETLDFLSNGVKLRNTSTAFNANGGTYVYVAFAEHPFVSSKGVPVTAR
jgi:hypothetical protein